MKRRDRQTARLLSVSEVTAGTTLSADAAIGATTLFVDDVSVFDESGWLYVGAQVVKYTAIDDDAGTVTLADALTDAADTDDFVARWSKLYNDVETVQTAQVAVLGSRDQGDELTVEVADTVDLPTGDRGGDGENCTIQSDGDVWTLIHASGRPSKYRGIKYEDGDGYELTADDVTAGTVDIPLSAIPIAESVKAWADGIFQPPTEYTVDYAAGMVTWPLDPRDPAGMMIRFHYAYRQTLGSPAFAGAATAAVNSTSITVTVPSVRQAGDLLLVAVARLLPSVPAGWTKVKEVPYGIGGLTVLSKTSDGTETTVTFTAGSSGDQGAICIVYTDGQIKASAKDLSLDVPSAKNYRAPSANGRTRVSFFLFDGVGTSGSVEEEISTVTGTQRANRTISSGLFSMAAVEGSRAVVTDASPDAGVHDWASITVGLS